MGTRTEPERFRDFDDQVAVNLRFPGGRLATMLLSYSGADLDDFRIVGTLGDLYSSPAFAMPGGFKHTVTIGERKVRREFSSPTDQFGGELKYFSDCIQSDKHPEADGEEGLLDIRVIAAVERALETGQPQQLEPYVRKLRPNGPGAGAAQGRRARARRRSSAEQGPVIIRLLGLFARIDRDAVGRMPPRAVTPVYCLLLHRACCAPPRRRTLRRSAACSWLRLPVRR